MIDFINKNKQRVEEIKKILEDRRSGRSAGSAEQQALKSKLAELRAQFQATLKQKLAIREQLEAASKVRDAVKASLRDLKSNMKFTTVEAIDEAIEKLEHRIEHSSLSLTEEKKILEDIRKLKTSRSAVGQYSEKLEALSQDDSSRSDLQAALKAADTQLNDIKAKEEKLRAELTELRSKEQETGSDVPALLQERETCREVCKQAYEKIKDLRAEHDVVWQEFKAADKLWREQQNEERARRREQAAAERAARDAERAARALENAPEPFDREITMCEQLSAYLSRFQVSSSASDATKSGEDGASKPVAALDGMKVFSRKVDEDDDPWGKLATGVKKGKGKKSRNTEDAGPEKLVHSIDILEAFSVLKISVPSTAAAVPAIVTDVAAQKEVFLAKREEAKAAKAAAAAEGAAEGVEGEAAAAAPAEETDAAAAEGADKKKGGKGGKKAVTAALKLDDASAWPAVGSAGAAAANGTSADDDEEEEEEAEEEAAAAPAAEAKKAEEPASSAPINLEEDEDFEAGSEEGEISPRKMPKSAKPTANGGVAVAFTVSDNGGISLNITHSD